MDFITAIFAFFAFLVIAIIWFIPIILIAGSDRTTGSEKVAWILAMIFVSWFAWIFYLLLAPIKSRRRYEYY